MNIRTPRVFLALGYLSLLSMILIGCRQKTKTTTGNTNGNATANAPDSKGIEKGSDDSTKITDLDPTTALYPDLHTRLHPNELDIALKQWNKAILKNPKDIDNYMNLGIVQYYLKQYDKALANFNIYLSAADQWNQDQNTEGANLTGCAYIQLKEYQKAITLYSKVLKENGNDLRNGSGRLNIQRLIPILNNRGVAYYHIKQYDKALADFTEAEQFTGNWNYHGCCTYVNISATYNALKEYNKAIDYATQALATIRLGGLFLQPLSHSNRGTAYLNLKQMDKAIADYTLAITFEPQLYPAQGTVYKTLGKTKPAP